MEKVLVDTDIIIDYLRRGDKTNSLFFRIFSQKDYLAVVSLTTITELWAGRSIKKEETLNRVKEVLARCQILLPDLETAKRAGTILRQTNYQISYQDAQIAALCFENKLPLLTLNEKDFRKVKGLRIFEEKE